MMNDYIPDNKVHGANMGPTWVLSAPGESHVGHMKIAIWDVIVLHGRYYISMPNLAYDLANLYW